MVSCPDKQLGHVLVKPAGPDCNLACRYCFYAPKSRMFDPGPHRMSEEVLETLIEKVMSDSGPFVSFGWQGGEPTLMGLDFFMRAVELTRKHGQGKQVGHMLQTNGILLDEKWARFLCDNSFLVGLSIDGPAQVHDRYRVMVKGKPTFEKVRDRAKLLLDEGIATNAMTMVTDYSESLAAELYGAVKELGLMNMQFIPCVEPDPADREKMAPFSVTPKGYGKFLVEVYDLWRADFKDGMATTTVRLFDSIFHTYVGLPAPDCELRTHCGDYLVIEHNGDIYPCDFFVEPDLKLGNIVTDSPAAILNSKAQKTFGEIKSIPPDECNKCKWIARCRGGCLKERGMNGEKRSYLCKSMKILFEHIDADMMNLADEWKARHDMAHGKKPRATTKVGRNAPCPCGSGKKFKKCCGT